jgi:serine/threonine protein phosphatase PrpC
LVEDIAWLGRYFEEKDKIIFERFSNIEVGFTIGKVKRKNEDCLRIGEYENNLFLAICDGHWGYFASEYAINQIITDIIPIIAKTINIKKTLITINTKKTLNMLWEHNLILGEESSSETTLLVVVADGTNLVWLSVGDSYLYALDSNHRQYQNTKQGIWLGRRIASKERLEKVVEFGRIYNWYKISIMSDGIPECIYGKYTIKSNFIFKLMNEPDFVREIVMNAMKTGGEDNIAIASIKNIEQKKD